MSVETDITDDEATSETGADRVDQKRTIFSSLWEQYRHVFVTTGGNKYSGFQEAELWFNATDLENEKDLDAKIKALTTTYSKEIIQYGIPLYEKFNDLMGQAEKYMSKESKKRWTERFYNDEKTTFRAKKYFIEHQFPSYVKAWKKVEEDRDEIAKNPEFETIVAMNPELSVLGKDRREEFLNMHYEDRLSLVQKAQAALIAAEKKQGELFNQTKIMLEDAVHRGILSEQKVGSWLKRIFTKDHSSKKIEDFLSGKMKDGLPTLMQRWSKVREDYDDLMKKATERGELSDARGFRFLKPEEFLRLHYEQRFTYVNELKERLSDAKNTANEKPIFLKIRHAMDVKDWREASVLIAQAKLDPALTEKDRDRLKSMQNYVKKFDRTTENEAVLNAVQAKRKMDSIIHGLQQTHSEITPMIYRLMQGPYAHRSLHQLRWCTYNNIWCRGRGYLTDDVAREGAKEQYKHMTKERAEQGVDIGRHDHISEETAGLENIRKAEMANHKATYRHLDIHSS